MKQSKRNRINLEEWWFIQQKLKRATIQSGFLEPRYIFSRCIIGYKEETQTIVYSKTKLISTLQEHYEWSETKALNWIEYNIGDTEHRQIINDTGEV